MDRIKARTKANVVIECVAPFDLQNVRLPGRNVLPDRCPFIYQGAGDHLDVHEKAQSGCTWHLEGKHKLTHGLDLDGTEYTVYVNIDDEYVYPFNLAIFGSIGLFLPSIYSIGDDINIS